MTPVQLAQYCATCASYFQQENNMKKTISTILAGLFGVYLSFAQDTFSYLDLNAALPLQAAVCDVIGVGRAEVQSNYYVRFHIDQFWYGDATNNPVVFHIGRGKQMPTNGTPLVFFASKYESFLTLKPSECHFSYILDMDHHRSRHEPDGLYLYDGERSWFPATPHQHILLHSP
jgi:hypothetical protein